MERVSARVEDSEVFPDPSGGGTVRGNARRDEEFGGDFAAEVARRLTEAGSFEPGLRERLPPGARALWEVRSGPVLLRRTRMVVVAAVLHPWRALAGRESAGPLAADRALAALPEPGGPPVLAAVLSTSGWAGPPEPPAGTAIYLVEPAPGEGFRIAGGPAERLPACLAPESDAELVARVTRYVAESRAALVLRGLERRETSGALGVPEDLVGEAFSSLAAADEFLRLSEEAGTLVLRRA